MQLALSLSELVKREPAGLFVIFLALLAIGQAATALARSRQWYLLPVAFGVTALSGFLLNPLADARTLHDLKTHLTSYEMLTLLCIFQCLLAAASLYAGSRLEAGERQDRHATCLALIALIPAPALLVAMLLLEQVTLAATANVRPEAVGRGIGLGVATCLLLAILLAACLRARPLALLHFLLSLTLALACMFVPVLGDPLPQPMTAIDWASLRLLAAAVPIVVAMIGLGYWLRAKTRRLQPANWS